MRPNVQRAIALVALLVGGIVSLPVSAYFLDGRNTENYIVLAQIGAMVILGAIVGYLLPGLGGAGASTRRGATVGALVGVGMSVVGVIVFFLLISGFDGE